MSVDPALLAILVCPQTRTPLRLEAGSAGSAGGSAEAWLVSDAAGLAYPVRDGVPILLVEAARPWP